MSTATVLDDALDLLGDRAPEYDDGFSNHGPMVVEALVHAGRADAVAPWAERYVGRLDPPVSGGPSASLGELASFPSWLARVEGELAGADWRTVAAAWVERLVDGAVAAAGHGLLRTAHAAHAARALSVCDTPARRAELARGLAYWAATHQRLPGHPRPHGRARAADALAALPHPHGRGRGFITDALRTLDGTAGFADAVDALDPAELDITRLVDAMAPLALVSVGGPSIVYVHALTVPAAARTLAGLVAPDVARQALAHVWQAMAGLAAAYPVDRPSAAALVSLGRPPSSEQLLEAAIANGDEHAVKVSVAALDEVAAGADPLLLHVALALLRDR